MLWWIWALIGLAVVFPIALYLHYRRSVARWSVALPYDLEETVPTPDGSAIELRRIGEGKSDAPPVLMVHGLALNHRNHDVLEDLSLARSIAKRGRDVWLLTLRSGRADLRWAERKLVTYARMAEHDLPLAVAEVRKRTGASRIDYVGFSMGGMLLYGALGRGVDPEHLRRAVIIGSPARLEPVLRILALARHVPRALIPHFPLRMLSRLTGSALELWITPIHRLIYNPENVDPGVATTTVVNGFVDIPSALNAEFAHWSTISGDVLVAGEPVVNGLARIAVPVLFVAGKDDRVAPPRHVRHAYEHWGRDREEVDKRFLVIGVDEGATGDYGHGDLAIGRFAPEDVFEPVGNFLAEEA